MPKVVTITDEDMEWLRENHDRVSYSSAAKRLGVCADTLKRILVREGLQDFSGAKYVSARRNDTQMWERPCMRCGDTEPRPKWIYFCQSCKNSLEF